MENRRYVWFLVAIGAGLIFGLILGWSVFPRKAAEMPLQDLRADYKLDYILMVATIYDKDSDITAAKTRLALVDDNDDPAALIQSVMGNMIGWGDKDVQVISKLLTALQAIGALDLAGRMI